MGKNMALTDEEIEWLNNNGPLIYAADRNAPPLRYLDNSDGQYKGVLIDYVHYLSIELGTKIELKPLLWEDVMTELSSGNADMCDMFASEDRSKKFLFSKPIYNLIDMFKEELKKDIYEIESNTLEYLLNYDYPGNIRELKNMIERLVVLSKNGILKMDNLGAINFPVKENIMNREVAPYEKAKEEFEREYFYNALKQHDFNVTHTANAIGISRRQLINKINKYNLRQEMGQ